MSGLELLLDVARRGVEFRLDRARTLRVVDTESVLTEAEYVLLRAVKHQIRDLLSIDLPEDPGEAACEALDAPAGAAICRRCARGIGEHFWRRVDLGDRDPAAPVCRFFVGDPHVDEFCRSCAAPFAEHVDPSHGPRRRETA